MNRESNLMPHRISSRPIASAELPVSAASVRFEHPTQSGKRRTAWGYLLAISLIWLMLPSQTRGSDLLRAEGMGNIRTALRSSISGAWDNPAALASLSGNLLGFHLGLDDWRYESLGEREDTRFTNDLNGVIQPGIYLARGFGSFGLGLGYQRHYQNQLQLSLFNTTSTYFVNEQRFEAQTDLALYYDTFWEKSWFIAAGYHEQQVDLGVRLQHTVETAKQGRLAPSLFLFAELEDVNPNKADEVIPAIMDGLEYDKDRLRHPTDDVERDRQVGAWDLDVGLQTDWFSERFDIPGLRVGVLLQHLLQRKRVVRSPMHLAAGANWGATNWLTAVCELGKRFSEAGPELHLGWEAHFDWTRYALGGIAIRGGWFRRDASGRLTFGLALRLGTTQWEYALIRPTGIGSLAESQHWFGSTVQF